MKPVCGPLLSTLGGLVLRTPMKRSVPGCSRRLTPEQNEAGHRELFQLTPRGPVPFSRAVVQMPDSFVCLFCNASALFIFSLPRHPLQRQLSRMSSMPAARLIKSQAALHPQSAFVLQIFGLALVFLFLPLNIDLMFYIH